MVSLLDIVTIRGVLSFKATPEQNEFVRSAKNPFDWGLRNFVKGNILGGTESMLGG